MSERPALLTSSRFQRLQHSQNGTHQLAVIFAVASLLLGTCAVIACADAVIGLWAMIFVALTAIAFLGMLAFAGTAEVTRFLLELSVAQDELR